MPRVGNPRLADVIRTSSAYKRPRNIAERTITARRHPDAPSAPRAIAKRVSSNRRNVQNLLPTKRAALARPPLIKIKEPEVTGSG